MSGYRRVALLVLTMSLVVAAATGVAISVLYETAFQSQRAQLLDTVTTQSQLFRALAHFDQNHRHDYPGDAESATLAQIRAALAGQPTRPGSTELTVGRIKGEQIEFLMRHRHRDQGAPAPVALDSGLATPMRRALAGESGAMIGLDYHGAEVLAAYAPVSELRLGLVAKVDLAEVREPFVRAGRLVLAVAAVLILLGSLMFFRLTNPVLARLRSREQQLDLILRSTGDGLFGLDLQGRCSFVNPAALQMLGYSEAAQLLGRDIHELVHCDEQAATHSRDGCPAFRAISRRQAVTAEGEHFRRADGSTFPVDFRARPMYRDQRLVGAVVSFRDISERLEREQQLQHARRLETIGRLTGGIAHDFNNLLTIIQGNLRLLARRPDLSADIEGRELLEDASSAAEDGAAVTRQLLAFSRKQALQPAVVELGQLLRESGRLLRRLVGEGIDLQVQPPEQVLPVYVDAQQLHNALINLALNASDAMPGGGRLLLRAGPRQRDQAQDGLPVGRYALLQVIDSGCGMSEEQRRRAVEPFYTTKPAGHGSGLGLSTVYGFAHQSGGALSIASTPGRSTTVSLWLPLVEAAPTGPDPAHGTGTQSAPSARPGTAVATARVLLVEDEARVRRLVTRALASMGCEVIALADTEAALPILRSARAVDLLLTDIVTPGRLDGRQLAARARGLRPGLKILLMTGYEGLTRSALGAEFAVLRKPFTDEQLREAVRRVLHDVPSTGAA